MYKILVLEDDDTQRNNLKKLIKKVDNQYSVFDAADIETAVEIARDNEIHLFLVDVNLKNESGIDFARRIRHVDRYRLSWIVFLTSHVQFMLEAFKDTHCYDYLLKPINENELEKILNDVLVDKISTESCLEEDESVIIEIGGVLIKIYEKNIKFIETYQRTTKIHTKTDILIVKNLSLSKLMEKIKSKNIVQSHKAFAVNVKFIESIEKNEISFFECKEKALVGKKFRKNILDQLILN